MDVRDAQSITNLQIRRRACLNCTSAKVKCTSASLNSESCQRCDRLEKGCIYSEPSSEPRRKSREISSVKRLEEKVDLLSTQLATLTQQVHSKSLNGSASDRSTSASVSGFPSSTYQLGRDSFASLTPPHQPKPVPKDSLIDIFHYGFFTFETAKRRLDVFREVFTHYFPFVVVPPTTGLESLRRDNPFLLLTIMAVTSFDDPPLQRKLGQEIKRQICDRMIMGYETSMDLLQGLLVFIAWYQYFCLPGKNQYFLMLQLSITMCHELKLDLDDKGKAGIEIGTSRSRTRSSAEMRALLGVYCLSSILAMVLRKRTIIHYTKYIEECCTSLTEGQEIPTDQLILPFVQVQALSRKISDTFSYHDMSTCGVRGQQALQITIDSFRRDLDGLKSSITPGLHGNLSLLLDLNFLEVWIHEVALYSDVWQNSFMPPGIFQPPNSFSTHSSLLRTNTLWRLVSATTSFHNWSLSVPNTELLRFSFAWWTKLSYIFIVQAKTVFLDAESSPGRQEQPPSRENDDDKFLQANFRRAAEKEVTLPRTLDMYLGKLATVTTDIIDEEGDRDVMYHYAGLLRSIRAGYESRIVAESPGVTGPSEVQVPDAQEIFPETGNIGDRASMPPVANTMQMEDLDFQLDFSQAGLDDFVWETMMNEFSFMAPQNTTSFIE